MSGRFKVICAGNRFGGRSDSPEYMAAALAEALGLEPPKEKTFEEWETEFVKKHVREFPSTNQPGGKTLKDLGLI